MIEITGAKRVVFDGNYNGSGRYLTFSNRQNSPTFYINGNTENLQIKNCAIEGNNQLLTSVGPGVINLSGLLGTGTSMHDILIDNNIIRNRSDIAQSVATAPNSLIHAGPSSSMDATSTTVKSNITISNNEMFNFRESAVQIRQNASGNGIGDNISIIGNKIYEVMSFTTYQYPIWLEGGDNSKGHTISNNLIGGNASPNPNITGTWVNSKADGEINVIYALNGGTNINDGITISGNTISNISLTGTGWGNFIGIRVESGYSKILNNLIGSLASSLSAPNITCAGNGDLGLTDNTMVAGIWSQSTQDVIIDNNTICGLATTNGYSFMDGIAHGSNLYLNGYSYNTPGGKATITNNQVLFCRSSSQLQSLTLSPEAFMGIFCWSNKSDNVISDNQVRNCGSGTAIWNTNVRIHGMFIGVSGSTTPQTGVVKNNKISHIFNENPGDNTNTTSRNPIIYGLTIANGNWTVSNNMIFLNNGTQGGTLFTDRNTSIRGLNDGMLYNQANCQAKYFYNTVYVAGSNLTGAGQANSTYAFLRFPLDFSSTSITAGAPIELKNNIFINDRGGLGNHRAIGNIANSNSDAAINWSGTTSDYNLLYSATASNIGLWGSSPTSNFSNWKTLSGGDNNSISALYSATSSYSGSPYPGTNALNPANLFTNATPGDLHISITDGISYNFAEGKGTPISISTDFDGDTRDASAPDIGADEFTSASCTPVAITSNPSAPAAACEGTNSFSLTVAVSGSPNYDYQWQISPDGTSWTNLTNGGVYGTTAVTTGSATTSNTLTITNADASYNGKQYRCIVNNCNGTQTATSSAATLTVNAASVGGTATAAASTVCTGNGTTINLTGYTGTIQWQTNASGSWQDISGQTGTSYTTPALTSTTSYQAVVTNSGCSPAGSTVAQVTVSPVSAGGTAGAIPTTICSGGTSTIKLTNYVGTIQWQTDASGTWQDISGATSDVYNTPALTTTTSYQAVVTSGACASALSNTIVITVEASPAQPDPIAGSIFPCYGSSQVYSVTNVSGINYTWTFPADWVQTAGGNTNSVTVTVGQDTNNIQVVPSNSCGTGTPRTILVKPSYPGIWTGAVSSDWHDPNNWGCNTLPDSTTNIKIPDGSGNLPIINTIGTAFCHDLIVVPNASLILQSAGDLSIYGNLTNYGSVTGLGTFVFMGQENAAINGPASGITLSKMTVSKKPDTSIIINVNIPLTISTATANALTFTSGLLQINSGGSLSLKSGPTINAGAGLHVNGGTLVAGNYSITNKGLFKVTSGVANIGTDPGNSLLSRSGSFTRIYGGQLNIAARLEVTCLSGITNTAYLTVSGGVIKLCTVENTAGNASFDIGAYSNIHVSGGIIEIQNASSNATPIDLTISTGTGTKLFTGGTVQFGNNSSTPGQHFNISNESVPFYNIAVINCADITLNSPVSLNGSLDLTLGNINANTPNLFRFNQGASWTSGSDNSFIKGPAEKVGNEAFVFPVGDIQGTNKVFAPMGIDAPSQITDVFRAQYGFVPKLFTNNPDSLLGDLGNTSNVENWDLSREVGTSQVKVSLYWKNNNRSAITDPNGILVAHWNASLSKWEDMGATYFSDGPTSGHIQAGVASNNFSPFTFGANKNYQSPLPVSLLEFKAECKGDVKDISWKTATETNNDYFTIERSFNGNDWQFVSNIDGAGNSNQVLSYNFIDNNDSQTIYYRLRQTDFNGQNKLYDPIIVNCNSNFNKDIIVYPNPFESLITLSLENIFDEDLSVNIYDVYGRIIEKAIYHISGDYNNMITLELDQLPAGIYYLEAKAKAFVKSTKIIKN